MKVKIYLPVFGNLEVEHGCAKKLNFCDLEKDTKVKVEKKKSFLTTFPSLHLFVFYGKLGTTTSYNSLLAKLDVGQNNFNH